MLLDGLPEHTIFSTEKDKTQSGRIVMVGHHHKSKPQAWRVWEYYALVYLCTGQGFFQDTLDDPYHVETGSLMLLFPEIGHHYGPQPGDQWQELWVVFDGAVFDLWQQQGILNPRQPILYLDEVDYWTQRFIDSAWSLPQSDPSYDLIRLCRLQSVLADALHHHQLQQSSDFEQAWLAEAKRLLEAAVANKPDYEVIAAQLSMSYHGFRKRFNRVTGMSPGKYHSRFQMQQASQLLLQEPLTLRQLAARFGYFDEFHFSKRFKQIIGMSPQKFRRLFAT